MSEDPSVQGQEHAMYSVIMGFIVLAIILGGVLYVFAQQNNDSKDNNDIIPTPTFEISPIVSQVPSPTATLITEDLIPTPTISLEQNEVTIELTGRMYEFSLDEIRVSKGSLVTIEFTSEDGFHDFNIDELGVSSERVNTGGTTSVQFVADQVGNYTFYCSVSNHRSLGMTGTFIVEE